MDGGAKIDMEDGTWIHTMGGAVIHMEDEAGIDSEGHERWG